VHNLTPLDWYGGPKSSYHLSYHWLDERGYLYQMEGIRSNLPATLKSGSQLELLARLRAPDKPGHYALVWDMVQEDVTWFSFKSAVYTPQPVEVVAGVNSGCLPVVSPVAKTGDKPDSPLALPVAPPNPERSQLWKVAVKMALDRPWLGVGPDGYRFAYGQYAGVRQWDNRIFANSTPLELAADLGFSGTLVFGMFFGLACWSRAKAGWLGKLRPLPAAGLVALVAFSLHGLLDYFFGAHVILIFFWILLGLARESDNAVGN
jgi:hypothetical protein